MTTNRERDYVLWLLSSRDYPRSKLVRKLKLRGVEAAEANAMLDALAEAGLYRESNYLRTRTRQLVKRGFGSAVVKSKLRQDKVVTTDEDIRRAFDEIGSTPRAELRLAVEKVLRRLSRRALEPRELRQKVLSSLMMKGHRAGEVLVVLEQILNGETEAGEPELDGDSRS